MVCGIVPVDHAAPCCLVKLLGSECIGLLGLIFIPCCNSFASFADSMLQLALESHVTLMGLLISENALLLRLNICQCNLQTIIFRTAYRDI